MVELIIIFLLFTLIVVFLYNICKLKEARLEKESKLFEEMYKQLVEDPMEKDGTAVNGDK